MMVLDITTNTLIVKELRVASNFFERMRGLIGTRPLEEGEGFLIPRCMGIHMLGMTYAIDALYLDKEGRVLLTLEDVQPNTLAKVDFRAWSVLELPAGTVERARIKPGDLLFFYGGDGGDAVGIPAGPAGENRRKSRPRLQEIFAVRHCFL